MLYTYKCMSVLIFFIVLSILVLVHEAGHFIAARRAGIWVEEFGFGIPPRIWGKKIGDTLYSINALPFGGFVRLHGENSEEGVTKPDQAFINKSKLTRATILTAGVIMNFLLAVFAFAIVYSFTGIPRETDQVRVVETQESSPASEVGIEPEEVIVSVNGEAVNSVESFQQLMRENSGKEISLELKGPGEEEKTVLVTPRLDPPEGQGSLGVIITSTEIYTPPIWQRPFVGVYYGLKESIFWGQQIIVGLGSLISRLFVGEVPSDVAGPFGIYAVTTQAARFGILPLINILGVISLNLAILNILPFPALDGGRLLFVAIESAFGKKVVPKIESYVHTIGMVFLLALLFAITAYDIQRLVKAGGVDGFIDSIIESAQQQP